MLEVVDPGALATVQDQGRPDAASLGVPRAGAADPLALAAANLLLGGDPGLPAIELTGGLPALVAREDTVLAVTGADIGLRAGAAGPWVRPGTSVLLRSGTVLVATGASPAGARTYLALPGGADVPRVLGSAATSPVGRFGGHEGRPLRAGDTIAAVDGARRTGAGHAWPGPGPSSGCVVGRMPIDLAVCDGPHRSALGDMALRVLATTWLVGDQADRVGLRLAPAPEPAANRAADGGATTHRRSFESFALTWGAIELPPDGAPIVLLPDGPTVGGYPVPFVVAGVDLPRLGQLRPGDRLRFRPLGLDVARAERLAADAALTQAGQALAIMRSVW